MLKSREDEGAAIKEDPIIGVDPVKNVFQLYGAAADGRVPVPQEAVAVAVPPVQCRSIRAASSCWKFAAERIIGRALRIRDPLDPRVGLGIYQTYEAQSWVMRWPLDQILLQDKLGLIEFERLPAFGSDHYPVLAELCLAPDLADRQSAPAIEPGDLAEAELTIARAREAR